MTVFMAQVAHNNNNTQYILLLFLLKPFPIWNISTLTIYHFYQKRTPYRSPWKRCLTCLQSCFCWFWLLVGNLIKEISYKGKDKIARKQLWRPEGRQLGNMQQFLFIIVNSKLLNLLSCLPFHPRTGFFIFLKLAEPSPVMRLSKPWEIHAWAMYNIH